MSASYPVSPGRGNVAPNLLSSNLASAPRNAATSVPGSTGVRFNNPSFCSFSRYIESKGFGCWPPGRYLAATPCISASPTASPLPTCVTGGRTQIPLPIGRSPSSGSFSTSSHATSVTVKSSLPAGCSPGCRPWVPPPLTAGCSPGCCPEEPPPLPAGPDCCSGPTCAWLAPTTLAAASPICSALVLRFAANWPAAPPAALAALATASAPKLTAP